MHTVLTGYLANSVELRQLTVQYIRSAVVVVYHCASHMQTVRVVGEWYYSSVLMSCLISRLCCCNCAVFAAKSNIACSDVVGLTLSPPIPFRLYTSPYWSNPAFLIFDIRALWRSGLSARAPECQKLKMLG